MEFVPALLQETINWNRTTRFFDFDCQNSLHIYYTGNERRGEKKIRKQRNKGSLNKQKDPKQRNKSHFEIKQNII